MKSLFKVFMVIAGVLLFVNTQAQNTGTNPFVNSTHTYNITKGSIVGTTLAWSVTDGTAGTNFNFVGATDQTSVQVQWLTVGTYTLQVTETRTDVAGGLAGCPTTRNITVNVIANTFDVIAALVTDADACATVVNPVVDVSADGDNSDDTFGTTTRAYTVSMAGGDTGKSWSFDYALTDLSAFNLGDITAVNITGGTATGNNIVVPAGTTEVTISISYSTNKNASGTNGQDPDFDIVLTLTNAKDQLGTPDSDGSNDAATYSVKAIPATTGITTD
ncbi:hypothetical protein [Marinifilum fragile]|uniref:hypothetical protein n=1 Tax=Marinifilum fragile TaxID=570161 RepID=UPI002AA8082E|nr:hypothetical protein [Marinifilum fragile]